MPREQTPKQRARTALANHQLLSHTSAVQLDKPRVRSTKGSFQPSGGISREDEASYVALQARFRECEREHDPAKRDMYFSQLAEDAEALLRAEQHAPVTISWADERARDEYLLTNSHLPQKQLAETFGVNQSMISKALKRLRGSRAA